MEVLVSNKRPLIKFQSDHLCQLPSPWVVWVALFNRGYILYYHKLYTLGPGNKIICLETVTRRINFFQLEDRR